MRTALTEPWGCSEDKLADEFFRIIARFIEDDIQSLGGVTTNITGPALPAPSPDG